jgi:hypothetical protein
LCGPVARAAGEEVSAQAREDDGTWLPYAPPPAKPAGICLIDSGVNENPDTTTQLVERTALDGGDPRDVSPIEHGTLMAMEASAPPNGWGMIGAAPGAVRVVSVRAESSRDSLTFRAYKQAIVECQRLAERRPELDVKVISMSIGFQTAPSSEQLAQLEDAASSARTSGLDLVAAAGDEGASALSYPAAVTPILSVGAYGDGHMPCPFSNGGVAAAILAPGCALTEASPATGAPLNEYAGTSQATAIVAAVLGALRAYEPELSPAAAEQLLTTTARANSGLDVAALFRAAGLSYLVEAGRLNEPPGPASPASAQPPVAKRPGPRDLPLPRVRLVHRERQWVLRLLNLPDEATATVRVARLLHSRATTRLRLLTRRPIIRFRARGPLTVTVIYRAGAQASSSTSVVRAR